MKIQLQQIILCTFYIDLKLLYHKPCTYLTKMIYLMNKKNILVGQSGGPTAVINGAFTVLSAKVCEPQRCGWLRLRYDKWNRGLSRGFLYEPSETLSDDDLELFA